MALLYARNLLNMLEPQARPVVAEEAEAYAQRGQTKANNRSWWQLRCMLRSLSLFCGDAQMAEVMISR